MEVGQGLCERLIGRRPAGMWPSEMAVGESVAGLAVRAGIDWMISDEEVLARSIDAHIWRDPEGRANVPAQLYRPYPIGRAGRSVAMVFRDSTLSNLIGFDYQRMSSTAAARHLMPRLRRIGDQPNDLAYPAVPSVHRGH